MRTTATLAVAAVLGAPGAAIADALPLPSPADPLANLPGVGLAPDRLLTSRTPGPVTNTEAVTVAVGPDGAPVRVTVEQRLRLTGTGDFQVRERGPARRVEPVGAAQPPVLKLGTVVWQGFSPGGRSLAARLTLDPQLEAARLPLAVRLTARDRAGARATLGPGGRIPGGATVTVTLVNQSTTTVPVTAGAADAVPLARALDTLLAAARHPQPVQPPVAGAGLPEALPGRRDGTGTAQVTAPLVVRGTVSGGTVTGPGTTATPGGGTVRGTLAATAQFTVAAPPEGAPLRLDLAVQPWLDARVLAPPPPNRSWRDWAAAGPDRAARAAATATLMTSTAAAARSASYVPYLDADLPGTTRTTFRYVVAPAAAVARPVAPMQPRPGAIALAALALGAILANAGLLWRLS